MDVVSFQSLLEEAQADATKRLSGNVTSVDRLFDPATVDALEAQHAGPLAFLAYDARVDVPVADYVTQGSLSADSGADLLVLFTVAAPVRTQSLASLAGIDVQREDHPASLAVRTLFTPRHPPSLPGIVLLPRLVAPGEALYVPLTSLSEAATVRARLREVFALTERAWAARGRNDFDDRLAVALKRAGIDYERSGRRSLGEWLLSTYQLVREHSSDIVAVVTAFL